MKAMSSTIKAVSSLDQLLEDQAINALAIRYPKDSRNLEATLLHCNFGTMIDVFGKNEAGQDVWLDEAMEKTTYAHALFKNQLKKEEIVEYFRKISLLVGQDQELLSSYMNLANAEGKTILTLIDEYDLKNNYQGIKQDIQRVAPSLFPMIRVNALNNALNIDTHTGSVHGSVDQSFGRLANNYLGRQVNPTDTEREILITRDAKWTERIRQDFNELNTFLANLEKDDKALEVLLKPTLALGEDIEKAKKELLFKVKTALRLVDPFATDKIISGTYRLDPDNVNTCGLTLKEMMAIGYKSISQQSLWDNPEQRNRYLIQFIDNLYVAKRGYNIDRNGPDEWQTHGQESDNNKCQGGTINQIAYGLQGNKLVAIKVIAAETMRAPLTKALEKILPQLQTQAEYQPLIQQWLIHSIIPQQLKAKLIENLQQHPEMTNQFSRSEIANLGQNVLSSLNTEEIKKILPKIAFGISNDQKKLLHQFVYDKAKGYIPYAQTLTPEQRRALIVTEVAQLNVGVATTDNNSLRATRGWLNFLLSSPDKEFAKEISDLAMAEVAKLPQEVKSQHFIFCAQAGQKILLKDLIDKAGINVNAQDLRVGENRNTALHHAAEEGHTAIVEKLLEKMSPEAIYTLNQNGNTALHMAAAKGHTAIVEKLLEKMSPEAINAKAIIEKTVLHPAAGKGYTAIVEKLLEKMTPEAINAKNIFQETALHHAAEEGHTATVERLLEKMSPEVINAQTRLGFTALHMAAGKGHTAILERLLEKMSPEAINAKDLRGNTALHMAAAKGHTAIVERLLEKMSPEAINAKDLRGNTALHWAAEEGHTATVERLLEKISPEAIYTLNQNGNTALHMAAAKGHTAIAETISTVSKLSEEIYKEAKNLSKKDLHIMTIDDYKRSAKKIHQEVFGSQNLEQVDLDPYITQLRNARGEMVLQARQQKPILSWVQRPPEILTTKQANRILQQKLAKKERGR